MTQRRHRYFAGGLITCLLLSLAGCQPAVSPTLSSPSFARTATETQPPTRLSSATPIITATPEPTKTATPRPANTLTPLPTLPTDEAEALVMELLRNNASCQLPCWWGITPSETSWETARQFLGSFVLDLGQGETKSYTLANQKYVVTNFGVDYKVLGRTDFGVTNYNVTNEIVDLIWVLPRGTELSYQLHQVLTTYGQPATVLFEADTDYSLFHLLLYYPHKGITAFYEGNFDRLSETYRICPQGLGPELWLWSPGKVFTLTDDRFIGPEIVNLMSPINEATDLTLETFYLTYQKSDVPCFETPREIWETP